MLHRVAPIAALLLAPFVAAQSVNQPVTATVPVENTLAIPDGATIEFTISGGATRATADTRLEFASNDGITYSILLEAAAWTFAPAVNGNSPGAYPVLRFTAATSTVGTASSLQTDLISSHNQPTGAAEAIRDIRSAAGEGNVQFEVVGSQEVVAGTYRTVLSYTLTAP